MKTAVIAGQCSVWKVSKEAVWLSILPIPWLIRISYPREGLRLSMTGEPGQMSRHPSADALRPCEEPQKLLNGFDRRYHGTPCPRQEREVDGIRTNGRCKGRWPGAILPCCKTQNVCAVHLASFLIPALMVVWGGALIVLLCEETMPELLAALDAFVQEHRRCGELDGGVDGDVVWMTCECGAKLARMRGELLDSPQRRALP